MAEKLHAIMHLGLANTRLKDFHDLVALSHTHAVEADSLRAAIEATFERRGTELPDSAPPGLSGEYASPERRRQWSAFLERNELRLTLELTEALEVIRRFVGPVSWEWDDAAQRSRWEPGRGWIRST